MNTNLTIKEENSEEEDFTTFPQN